ncbi:MAG: hypothetical protein JOZ04_16580, partial [Acidimicrobiia bacterium]|nr:hypothetical protein [Acidimicrobiia bacterium]
ATTSTGITITATRNHRRRLNASQRGPRARRRLDDERRPDRRRVDDGLVVTVIPTRVSAWRALSCP